MGRSLRKAAFAQEAERQTLEAAARARAELERRQAAAAEEMARLQTESETPNTAALIPGVSAAESELREALRLEELERRTRSLRALPVAQSYRDPNATAESSEAGTGGAADADVALLENAVQAALASFEQSVGALEEELEAGLSRLLSGSWGRLASPLPTRRAARVRAASLSVWHPRARLSPAGASGPLTRRAGSGSTRARSSKRCSSLSSRAISRDRCSPWSRSRSIRPIASGS